MNDFFYLLKPSYSILLFWCLNIWGGCTIVKDCIFLLMNVILFQSSYITNLNYLSDEN